MTSPLVSMMTEPSLKATDLRCLCSTCWIGSVLVTRDKAKIEKRDDRKQANNLLPATNRKTVISPRKKGAKDCKGTSWQIGRGVEKTVKHSQENVGIGKGQNSV